MLHILLLSLPMHKQISAKIIGVPYYKNRAYSPPILLIPVIEKHLHLKGGAAHPSCEFAEYSNRDASPCNNSSSSRREQMRNSQNNIGDYHALQQTFG